MVNYFNIYPLHRRLMILAILLILAAEANSQSFRETVYQAFITENIDLWERSLKERLTVNTDTEGLYETAMACYGFIGYCISKDEKDRGRPFLDRAEFIASELLNESPQDPRYVALRGALYGFRFLYQPQKIMTIGPKALKSVNRAMELGPDCPKAWIEAGNKDWLTPAVFGGSREKAVEDYETAIRLMEQDSSDLKNNWYYLNAHMVLAGWYKERNMTFRSREVYRKVLSIEPRFDRARQMLAR